MKTETPKMHWLPITAPDEIRSIERNGLPDINGFRTPDGKYFGLKYSVERYRARSAKAAQGTQ